MMTDDDVNKVAAQVQAALRAAGVVPAPTAGEAAGAADPGARPQVRMPGDNRLVSTFAKEIGEYLAKDGVYLRDGVPVVIDPVRGRIVDLEPDCFRSYVEKSVVVVRMRTQRGSDDPPIPVPVTMSRDTAKAVLSSHDFRALQRPVRQVWHVPVPVRAEDGTITLAGPGYVPSAQILITGGSK